MKRGFTLAEVLITLVIIGVIAAMTIPTLISSTGDQEYKTGLKKAFATLNQVVAVNSVLGDYDEASISAGSGLTDLLNDKLTIVEAPASPAANTGCNPGTWTYTADGFRYGVTNSHEDGAINQICVDVNGDKGPNKLMEVDANGKVTTSGDTFKLNVFSKKVTPADDVTSWILYNRSGVRS